MIESIAMKFIFTPVISIIFVALVALNACSKQESKSDSTKMAKVQVVDEKLKPFIGKWGVPKVSDCVDGGVTISEKILRLVIMGQII